MTKLFLIMYVTGQIGGYAGPLPYDKTECDSRAASLQEDADTVARTGLSTNGKNEAVSGKDLEMFKTMRFACEFRDIKPELGEREASL
ncbi:hypothetical protein EVC24_166 [Rhizobium phage RHph_I4]|nr:hypothetical protein EVC24_166 [Rhizobium phage RHph_I4]